MVLFGGFVVFGTLLNCLFGCRVLWLNGMVYVFSLFWLWDVAFACFADLRIMVIILGCGYVVFFIGL